MRLDRWLWAARQYRTRSLATRAVTAGRVKVNERRVKPGSSIGVGDRIRLRRGPYELELVVQAVSERRGPAAEAVALYAETAESRRARELHAARLKLARTPAYEGKGRPTKRERRALDRLRQPEE